MPVVLKDRTRPSLYKFLDENSHKSADLRIICSDGVVDTYQAVFAWASSFLRRQFSGKFVMEDSGKRKDDLTVHLPDVSVAAVAALASFLVIGEVTNLEKHVKEELKMLWNLLAIDRVEFAKLNIAEIIKEPKKSKSVPNVKFSKQQQNKTKPAVIHTIVDESPSKPTSSRNVKPKSSKVQAIDDRINKKAFENLESISVSRTVDEPTAAVSTLTLDNYDDVSIIVPGYENVEIDDKSLICRLEDIPIEDIPIDLASYQTSFEIPNDTIIFPAIDDETLEAQKINVLKRKQNEVDAYIEQRLKASKLDNLNKTQKVIPKLFASKQQEVFKKSMKKETAVKPTKVIDPEVEPLACYVCNSIKDKEKRALNLKNVFYLKNHISKCLYMSGRLFAAIDPGDENRDDSGRPVDEFGLKNGFWYRCEIEGCWLQQKKGVHGQVCYKVFAIHMASQHGVVEAVMVEDGNDAALELVQKIRDHEERRNRTKMNPKLLPKSSNLESISSVKKSDDANSLELEEKADDPPPVNPFSLTSTVRKKPAGLKEENSQVESGNKLEFKILGINGYHNCFICNGVGRNNKDGIGLSFKDIPTLKEHYARCIYNESKYFDFVSPGEGNTAEDGSAVDEFGQINGVMYKCPVKGCWLQKKTGERGKVCYKVYAIHMASQHGIVEQILEADSRPVMQEILLGLKLLDQVKNGIARCRFDSCSTMQFKADSKRELKLHYASMHFRNYFKTNPETGIPPGFTKSGTRAICENCSEKAGKPVYIQGDREAVVGHLVVKHDVLADILKEAGETVKEAREVISDIYPDQLTEVYMDTLDRETTPFNEDFMHKIKF